MVIVMLFLYIIKIFKCDLLYKFKKKATTTVIIERLNTKKNIYKYIYIVRSMTKYGALT